MSNCGGSQHQHCLIGMKPPASAMYKRRNKAKARARKATLTLEWQAMLKGA